MNGVVYYWRWDAAGEDARISWCQERGWGLQYSTQLAKRAWCDLDHDTRTILLDRHSYIKPVNPPWDQP